MTWRVKSLWVVPLLCLLACQSASTDRPALTRAELLNPESCKDCHPKHYREWSASMHAYAAKDPVFIAMNKRGQRETNGALREFCINCHAPMAVRENAITSFADLSNVPEQLQGVTCYFCHNAVGVGPGHVNAQVAIANDDIMRAALKDPLQPSTHRVAYSAFHDGNRVGLEASQLCGSCHDISTPAGVRLERTLEEYESSIFAHLDPLSFQSCADCHMPSDNHKQPAADSTGRPGETVTARALHEHLWPAVDVPLGPSPTSAIMRSAVACELPVRSISYFDVEPVLGASVQFNVTIESNAGHSQPSGAGQDRRMWVEAIAFDAAGNELERQGVVADGAVEETPAAPHPFMLRDRMKDAAGQDVHMFWQAASYESFLLPTATVSGAPAGAHGRSKMFQLQMTSVQPAKVVIRVKMRPIGLDVLQDLVASGDLTADIVSQMPTFTVLSKEATWIKEQANYSVLDTTQIDCDSYPCLLDPEGLGCM